MSFGPLVLYSFVSGVITRVPSAVDAPLEWMAMMSRSVSASTSMARGSFVQRIVDWNRLQVNFRGKSGYSSGLISEGMF